MKAARSGVVALNRSARDGGVCVTATCSPETASRAAQMSPYAPCPTPFFTSYRSSTSNVVPRTTYCRLVEPIGPQSL